MRSFKFWFPQRNLSIKTTLIVGFVSVMFLFIATVAIAILTLTSYQDDLQKARTLDGTAIVARNMRSTLRAEALTFTDLLLRQEIFLEEYYQANNKELQEQQIPALLSTQLLPDEVDQLNTIVNQNQKLTRLFQQGIDLTKAHNFEQAIVLWNTQIKPQVEVVVARNSKLADALYERANVSATQADSTVSQHLGWVFIALFAAIVLGAFVAITTIRAIVRQNNRLETTLTELKAANSEIGQRQEASGRVSQQVVSLAAELRTTASQQASGSQEQVAVVAQINTSVNELSLTAANITDLTVQVNETVTDMAADSREIEQSVNLSVAQNQKGRLTVNRTLAIGEAGAGLYQELLNTMNELEAKSANMRRILDLLGSISAETHLLSLNAAIEAAGAGEFGERFRVVAQEVKNLAGRSTAANKEVIGIIKEVVAVTTRAGASAQIGYEKAQEMREAVEQSGEVIEEMRQISEHCQHQATSISQRAHEVKAFIETIKNSTRHQQTASEQVLSALLGLSTVAQQNANGSSFVSASAVNLEQVSHNLNLYYRAA